MRSFGVSVREYRAAWRFDWSIRYTEDLQAELKAGKQVKRAGGTPALRNGSCATRYCSVFWWLCPLMGQLIADGAKETGERDGD